MAVTNGAGTKYGPFSTAAAHSMSFTPSGTPAGIVVLIAQTTTNADQVSGVTYGGVPMTRVVTAQDAAGEPGRVYAYFLGSNIPTGTRSAIMTSTGTAPKIAWVANVVAGTVNTEVSESGFLETETTQVYYQPNGSYSVNTVIAYAVAYTGQAAPTNLVALGGTNNIEATGHDFGNQAARSGWSVSGGSMGWNGSAVDDTALCGLIIKEQFVVTSIVPVSAKISTQVGKDSTDITFASSEPFNEYMLRLVTAESSLITDGSLIEQAVVALRTSHTVNLTDDEIVAAEGGLVEGPKRIKAFVRSSSGFWTP